MKDAIQKVAASADTTGLVAVTGMAAADMAGSTVSPQDYMIVAGLSFIFKMLEKLANKLFKGKDNSKQSEDE